ncbi:MAG: T9SS type A sorting domain-containing protein [Nonlabens sp.]|uniref:T9SS type A sorting domain-containing protein n=1 Tax=Nonlabens sp. TaxID=1888209 RepID=UPI003EF5C142
MLLKKLLFAIAILSISVAVAQPSWSFNSTDQLDGWSTNKFTAAYTANSAVLTTQSGNNPRIQISNAGINTTTYKFAKITLKVGAGGPTLLRVGHPLASSSWASTVITNDDSSFKTYYVDMSNASWSSTVNEVKVQFKTDNGSVNGSTYDNAGKTVEIQSVSFQATDGSGGTGGGGTFTGAVYLDLNNGTDNNSSGSSSSPFKTIPYALDKALARSKRYVYVKTGEYSLNQFIDISTNSTELITMTPEPGGKVKFNLIESRNFHFDNDARNIEIKGFEIDGKSNVTNHYDILANYVWQPDTFSNNLSGGGIAIKISEAQDIRITNNVIHDFYQKAVNIEDGRYIQIKGNVIYNIGKTSLSGGHGIMRQQRYGHFANADDPNKYRWEIEGNFLLNIHQRIYSWVPRKGYMNWTLDEGKSILIDEIEEHDTGMKAIIKNNVVAYHKIDGIRLKYTNNLEVSNNTVYSQDPHADGITDTQKGFVENNTPGTPFLNFNCFNNAVQVDPSREAFELVDAQGSTGSTFSNNQVGSGIIRPSSVASNVGAPMFKDPDDGDFALVNPSPNLGAPQSIIAELKARAAIYDVVIENDNWVHDHNKNTQTLLDNVPGVEDGISNNEPVFKDAGVYARSDQEWSNNRMAYYFNAQNSWEAANGVVDSGNDNVLDQRTELDAYDGMYEIIVPEDYATWYERIRTTHLRDTNNDGAGDTEYGRIRYGASVVAQNKILKNNSLHVVEIASSVDYTQMIAKNNSITVNGDILIDFNYTPAGYEVFDLIVANNITSANASGVFDNIKFEGYTGSSTLQIVPGSPDVIRLTLTQQPAPIAWRNQAWSNTTGPTATDNALIDDDFTVPSNLVVKDLIINSGKNLVIPGDKRLKVNGNLANSGSITFKSDATGTGRFSTFNGEYVGEGDIIVERFIPQGKRAFRLLASPVNTTDFISDNWQQDTHITGSTEGLYGFDASGSGNPSMFRFNNQLATGNSWESVTSTNTNRLKVGEGYRTMIRGDRNVDLTAPALATMNAATTLTATGKWITGNVTFDANSDVGINNTTNYNGFSMIGNPYISPVNWNDLTKTGITNTYYVWDPNMGSASDRGRYVAYNGLSDTNDNASSQVDEHIQTGQAIFVQNSTNGTAGSITFKEADKSNQFNNVFSPAVNSQAKISVSIFDPIELANGNSPIDGTVAVFSSLYSAQTDGYDSIKLESPGENLAWLANNDKLAVNATSIPVPNDELSLHTLRLNANTNYSFKVTGENFSAPITAHVVDNFLGTMTLMALDSDTIIDFSTTTDAASMANDRFKIVFSGTLSIANVNMEALILYPNPATSGNGFEIQVPDAITDAVSVKVYNMLGQEIGIEFTKIAQGVKVTPHTALSSGNYIVHITAGTNVKSMKWMVR